jgi:hypothetical protein
VSPRRDETGQGPARTPDRGDEDLAPETTRGDQPLTRPASEAAEEGETPGGLESGGPAGTLPVGPATDDVEEPGPPLPGGGPPHDPSGGEEPGPDDRRPVVRDDPGGPPPPKPLTEWPKEADDDDGVPGVGVPPA